MSFQIGDWVKIVNPNHCKFGFVGKVDAIECRTGERPKYRIGKVEGLTHHLVTVEEYEIKKEPIFTINTNGYQLGNIKFEPNDFGGMNIRPINSDDTVDSLKYYIENKKGEKDNMELLDIYESRKKRNIRNEYSEKRTKIINEDIFKNLTLNFEKQIIDLYKNEYDKEISFAVVLKDEMITKETKERLDKIEKEEKEEVFKIIETLEEVKAQLELSKDYDTQMKILKRYDIIGKDGKINA